MVVKCPIKSYKVHIQKHSLECLDFRTMNVLILQWCYFVFVVLLKYFDSVWPIYWQ